MGEPLEGPPADPGSVSIYPIPLFLEVIYPLRGSVRPLGETKLNAHQRFPLVGVQGAETGA